MNDLNKFVLDSFKFIFFPFLVIGALFIYYDPFCVFNKVEKKPGFYVEKNRGHFSIRLFKKNYQQYKYNSFIFSSSRGVFYSVREWEDLLGGESKGFHMDQSMESLFGLSKKSSGLMKIM